MDLRYLHLHREVILLTRMLCLLCILDHKGHLSVHWLFICRGLLRQEEAPGLLTNIGDLDVVGRHSPYEQQAIMGRKRHQHLYSK